MPPLTPLEIEAAASLDAWNATENELAEAKLKAANAQGRWAAFQRAVALVREQAKPAARTDSTFTIPHPDDIHIATDDNVVTGCLIWTNGNTYTDEQVFAGCAARAMRQETIPNYSIGAFRHWLRRALTQRQDGRFFIDIVGAIHPNSSGRDGIYLDCRPKTNHSAEAPGPNS